MAAAAERDGVGRDGEVVRREGDLLCVGFLIGRPVVVVCELLLRVDCREARYQHSDTIMALIRRCNIR